MEFIKNSKTIDLIVISAGSIAILATIIYVIYEIIQLTKKSKQEKSKATNKARKNTIEIIENPTEFYSVTCDDITNRLPKNDIGDNISTNLKNDLTFDEVSINTTELQSVNYKNIQDRLPKDLDDDAIDSPISMNMPQHLMQVDFDKIHSSIEDEEGTIESINPIMIVSGIFKQTEDMEHNENDIVISQNEEEKKEEEQNMDMPIEVIEDNSVKIEETRNDVKSVTFEHNTSPSVNILQRNSNSVLKFENLAVEDSNVVDDIITTKTDVSSNMATLELNLSVIDVDTNAI